MAEEGLPTKVIWRTKIAVVLREDLKPWQELNITAFLVSGIAATVPDIVGEPYLDGSGNSYLPMFRQPVLVFTADADLLRQIHERAIRRAVPTAIYAEDLFATNNDADNRAAVRGVPVEKLRLVGLLVRSDSKVVDKIVKGAGLHS